MTDPARLPLLEAARLMREGSLTADDLLTSVRKRIRAHDAALGCFRRLDASARAPDGPPPPGASPLWGIPGALKANICRRGWVTDCASRILHGWVAPYDAVAVTRLDTAGAVLLGSGAMDEFGMGSSTEHAHDLRTRNPWAPDRTAGGSSGGVAAAVAAGLAMFALGSDTGGSVRQPAHCCGVVGLKPGYGRVPRSGLVAHASSLDVIGVLARTVDDAGAVFSAIAGRDPSDATSVDGPAGVTAGASSMTVGIPAGGWDDAVEPDQARALDTVADALTSAGVTLREVAAPDTDLALAAYAVIAAAEASADLARYDGTHFGVSGSGPDHGTAARSARTAGFGLEVKLRTLVGAHVLSSGSDLLDRARTARTLIASSLEPALQSCHALLWPTCDGPAFRLGERLDDPVAMRAADRWTVPANLAGLPALTVPVGNCSDGLPLSCQLVGRRGGEGELLALGQVVEQAMGFRLPGEVAP